LLPGLLTDLGLDECCRELGLGGLFIQERQGGVDSILQRRKENVSFKACSVISERVGLRRIVV
jgi:hypothetical protein